MIFHNPLLEAKADKQCCTTIRFKVDLHAKGYWLLNRVYKKLSVITNKRFEVNLAVKLKQLSACKLVSYQTASVRQASTVYNLEQPHSHFCLQITLDFVLKFGLQNLKKITHRMTSTQPAKITSSQQGKKSFPKKCRLGASSVVSKATSWFEVTLSTLLVELVSVSCVAPTMFDIDAFWYLEVLWRPKRVL